jgi:hypothetical protein
MIKEDDYNRAAIVILSSLLSNLLYLGFISIITINLPI